MLGKGTTNKFEIKNTQLINEANQDKNGFYLSANNSSTFADFAIRSKNYVSVAKGKAPNEYTLLITSIRMEKKINEKELYLTFYFKGSYEPIKLTVTPYPWD